LEKRRGATGFASAVACIGYGTRKIALCIFGNLAKYEAKVNDKNVRPAFFIGIILFGQ
jgi:hypothetical protein